MKNKSAVGLVVLVVTYGSKKRYPSLLSTINSAIDAGAKQVFVVGNGTEYNLKQTMGLREKVEVLSLEGNHGSAFGFTYGIHAIINSKHVDINDYVLILDDDVLVRENLLVELKKIRDNSVNDKTVWSLLRVGRDDTFTHDYDKTLLSYNNTIAAFTVFSTKKTLKPRRTRGVAEPPFAPWAGFLLTKSQLQKIKLPDIKYFVYVEDQVFSFEVQRAGFTIRRSASLGLDEGSTSWFQSKTGTATSGYRAYYRNEKEPGRFLYKIRNDVYFITREGFVTSKFKYGINVLAYLVLGFFKYAPKNKQGIIRFRHLVLAVKLGLSGELGENSEWSL